MSVQTEAILRHAVADELSLAPAALAEPWLTAAYCDAEFVAQSHHRLISRELKRFADTPGARLAISTPPQVGKTWLAVCWMAFWLLARDPTTRIIIGSYSKEPAKERGEFIRDLIIEHGAAYGLKLKRGASQVTFFKTTQGGYVRSVGRGGSTTGLSADVFLVDDPIKDWIEAMSPALLDKVWFWLGSVVRTRLSAGGRVMLISTRWSRDDPHGRYTRQQPGRWREVVLPAIATDPDDPLGRAIGDPLPKPGIPEEDRAAALAEWEGARDEVPEQVYMALYQADPRPPSSMLISPEIMSNRIDLSPAARRVETAVSVDPNVRERHSRTKSSKGDTCGIVAGWLGDDQRLYITHDKTTMATVAEWPQIVMKLAFDVGASVIYVEGNNGGGTFRPVLVAAWDGLKRTGRVSGFCPKIDIRNVSSGMSKEDRAEIVAGLIEVDKVRLAARLPELFGEWTTWCRGDPSPGRIDASGQLALRMLPDAPTGDGSAASPADSGLLMAAARQAFPWRG